LYDEITASLNVCLSEAWKLEFPDFEQPRKRENIATYSVLKPNINP